MKRQIAMILAVVFIISSVAFASSVTLPTPDIKVSLLKYTPYPAAPGNYVTLTLKVENTGGGDVDNVRLKISPSYPFSLDSNSTAKIENSATPIPVASDGGVSLGKLPANEYVLVDYNIRLAADTMEGNSQIEVWHQTVANDIWITDEFDILVQGSDRLEVSDVNPSTLTPGKPTATIFVLKNSGTAFIRDVAFTWTEPDNKILPLGSGNKKYVASIGPNETAEVSFTLITDPSVTSGAYNLNANVTYMIGSNLSKSLSVNIGMFVGGNGEFDVSLQQYQSGSITLSVANIGANPTTSVTVGIPQQESFSVVGASESFVGNLNPGDFTSVTFQLVQRGGNMTAGQRMSRAENMTAGPGTLKVQISYTDTNSNRQVVEKEVSMFAGMASGQAAGQFGNQSQRSSGSGLNLIIIGIVGIVVIILVIKYNRKIRGLFKKKAE